MSRIRIVKGLISKRTGGDYNIYSDGNIISSSATMITESSDEGVAYGDPKSPEKKEVIESKFSLKSTYVHEHLLCVAKEMIPKFNKDDTSIIYKFYKAITDGQIINLPIEVSKNSQLSKVSYNSEEKIIIIWETSLYGVEKDENKKIRLLEGLTKAYSFYLNDCLKEIGSGENFESYDYDLFRFDAMGSETVIIGELETPIYKGNVELSFDEAENSASDKYEWKPEKNSRAHGPNLGDDHSSFDPIGNPSNPIPNIGFKFSYSLKGGFSASIYVGISKSVSSGNMGVMGGLNTALTYYGRGSIGTSKMSPTLVTMSATPSITLGYKTGNELQMNLFNQHAGSGVYNPYEYSFTLGTTGILSSGNVSSEFNPETEKFEENPYNSFDITRRKSNDNFQIRSRAENHTRNQIVGGAAVKIGNFMIASYNDIYKPPLFFGMGSDEYWSAGINMQAKLPQNIKLTYAVDMYYGKSNNNNPYNLDKISQGQNYDYQQLFDVVLNRGQETFSITDAKGELSIQTKFGYGTFWPSNAMHDNIAFPEIPKEPQKPIRSNYDNDEKFNAVMKQYKKDLEVYKQNKINYDVSINLKAKPTFHHLYVVYSKDNQQDMERIKKYLYAGQSEKGKLLKELYILNMKNDKNKKTN